MSIDGVVTGPNLGDEFDQGNIAPNEIRIKTGAGLVRAADGTISATGAGTLAVTTQEIYHEFAAGGSTNGLQAGSWGRNATLTRTGAGRWTVALTTPHPDGNEYNISATTEEQSNLRDTPDITVVQGSKTANGFQFQITTGDNGGGADTLVDSSFSFGVAYPLTVLTGAALV